MINKFIDKHPIISGVIVLMIIPLFYTIWKVGADTANKFAGIFTPFIVACVTIYLSNRQHKIADAQRAVAVTQAKTASNKLRLDLFDKRFDLYQNIIEIKLCFYDIFEYIDFKIINEDIMKNIIPYTLKRYQREIDEKKSETRGKIKKLESELGKVEFLFNEISYYHCSDIIRIANSYLNSIELTYEDENISYYKNDYYELYFRDMNEVYSDLQRDLKPYMDLSNIQ